MRLFLLYAVVELAALVAVVSWLGFGPTLMVLLAGAVLGMWLVRREGSRTALAVAEAVRAGRVARAELTDGALIGLAGLLIMVPGLVSDLLGLLLVLPPGRAVARRWLAGLAQRRSPRARTARPEAAARVVEGQVVDVQVVRPSGSPEPPSPGRATEG